VDDCYEIVPECTIRTAYIGVLSTLAMHKNS